jgi:hypothetical protein
LIQDFQAFVVSDGLGTWGASGLYLPSVVIVMSIFAIGFSYAARKRGWLT